MLEKPAQELLMAEGHHAALAVMRVILPSERDVSVGHVYQPMVGDRNAMGIASQVMQDVFRSAKWPFRIDYPILVKQSTQKSGECLLLHQRLAGPEEGKLFPAVSAFQPVHELAAKNAAQYSDRQEEAIGCTNPPGVIRR